MASSRFDDRGLAAFARTVLGVARSLPESSTFCGCKVYVSEIWKAFPIACDSRARFDELLVAAHQARLLALARADLVEAMDFDKVRDSEIAYLNARFHFVTLPERRAWARP